jgi:hypothetical protein
MKDSHANCAGIFHFLLLNDLKFLADPNHRFHCFYQNRSRPHSPDLVFIKDFLKAEFAFILMWIL